MKIMVLTAVHNAAGDRREVYEIFCKRMEAVRDNTAIETLIVGSEGSVSEDIARQYGHHYVEHENKPLSYKFNAGMRDLREHSPDYVMILGSDDIASDSFFDAHVALADGYRYGVIGVHDLYFMGLHDKRWGFGVCGYWNGHKKRKMLGVGRMVSSDILDSCDWTPWYDSRNAGMDAALSKTIQKAGAQGVNVSSVIFGIKNHHHLLIDIKTRGNISSMSNFELEGVDYTKLFYEHLPYEEAKALTDYCTYKINSVWNRP